MFLHVDGARLANAAATLGLDIGAFGSDLGIDVLSFGGTKNGPWEPSRSSPSCPGRLPLKFIRKQSMQLASKMRFVAAQYIALLTDDLWLTNATHANAMAQRLARGAAGSTVWTWSTPSRPTACSPPCPQRQRWPSSRDYPFYVWDDETGVVRWMASFDTTEDDVDRFVERLAEVMGAETA